MSQNREALLGMHGIADKQNRSVASQVGKKGDDKRCDVASPCSQGTLAKVLVVWKSGNPAHVHAILS